MKSRCLCWLLPLLLLAQGLGAQEDLRQLTDAEVLEQLHRQEVRRELERRLRAGSPETQRALAERVRNPPSRPRFPQTYTAEELIPYLANIDDFRSRERATEELRTRYENGDPTQQKQILQALRRALVEDFRATEGAFLRSPSPGLTGACGQILPAETVLELAQDIYLAEESPGHLTAFLRATDSAKVKGPQFGEMLAALYERVQGLEPEALRQMGENEELAQLIISALSRGGDPAYNFLLELGWEGSPLRVRVLASFDKPEVKGMLMGLYAQTPAPRVDRLTILSALNRIYRRNRDEEVRDFIREHLPHFLQQPREGAEFRKRADAVQLAGATKDPFFAPYLSSLASGVQALSGFREEYTFEYDSYEKSLNESIQMLQSSSEAS